MEETFRKQGGEHIVHAPLYGDNAFPHPHASPTQGPFGPMPECNGKMGTDMALASPMAECEDVPT